MNILLFLLFIIFISIQIVQSGDLNSVVSEKGHLVFATVLFRHGDRTPIKPYAKDPYQYKTDWPVDFGHLTTLGKQQEYQLGKWLRKRYNDTLLNQKYDYTDIYIESSDLDRTLQSASTTIAAMYPPKDEQIFNKNINWQPIPIHTIPKNLDIKLHAGKLCPAHDYYLKKLFQTKEFLKMNEKYQKLYDYLSQQTGDNIYDPHSTSDLYDTIHIQDIYNKTLPDWTQIVYPGGDFEYLTNFSFILDSYTPELARLKYGSLLKEILERFQNKIELKLLPDRKMWLYSGHDTTISNLLNILGLFNLHAPPYSSAVIFELKIFQHVPYVQIFYKNTTESPKSPLQPLRIPKCDDATACPLSKMFKLFERVILNLDRDEECKLLPNMSSSTESFPVLLNNNNSNINNNNSQTQSNKLTSNGNHFYDIRSIMPITLFSICLNLFIKNSM